MSAEYHILGHCNVTLAAVIDTLLSLHPHDTLDLTIVSNIPVDDPTRYDFRDSGNLTIREITSAEWGGQAGNIILGVVNPGAKDTVFRHFRAHHGIEERRYCTLVHPAATVGRQGELGPGVSIAPGAVLGPYVNIGAFTSINRNASIGHHTSVGRYCKIGPGSNVAGKCRIGDCVTIGIGSSVFDGMVIGNHTVVSGGAIVSKPLQAGIMAAGSPARAIRGIVKPGGEG